MRIIRCTWRWWMPLILSLAVLLVSAPSSAFADGPFADPAYQPPQGGGAAPAPARPAPDLPPTYQELPVFATAPAPARLPSGQPLRQDGGGPTDLRTWYDLLFNPGKWATDTVLGALSGVLYSVAAMFSALGLWAWGGPESASGYVAANGILFMTPPNLTIASSGTTSALVLVQEIARGLLVLVAIVRLLNLYFAPDKSVSGLTLFRELGIGVVLVLGAGPMCAWLIDVANAMSGTILADFTFTDPYAMLVTSTPEAAASDTMLSLVLALATLLYYAVLAWLALLAVGRLVLANLLIMLSPLLGLSFATGSWQYGQLWFARFLEVLVTPILWGLALGLARQFMDAVAAGLDPVISYLLGAYLLFMVPKVTLLVGLANRHLMASPRVLTTVLAVKTLLRVK